MAQASNSRRQVAALAFRSTISGSHEVLVITSRETSRFVIPKGWPIKGLSDADAAAREAYEEAGVVGKVRQTLIGSYTYWKRLERSFEFVEVDVYALKVKSELEDWPEKESRQRSWLAPKDAAELVDEPELTTLIRQFRGKSRRDSSKASKPAPEAAGSPRGSGGAAKGKGREKVGNR